jgi:DNA-binding MarR family transcriptional regulator
LAERPSGSAGGAPSQPPDLSAALSSTLPGVDPTSTLLLMRAGRLGRLVELHRSRAASLDDGLDVSGATVLGALLMLGPPHRLSPTFLSRYVVQTSGGMTKTLRRLETDGLVVRVPDERDRRVSYVQLTAAGKKRASASLTVILAEWEDALRARGIDVGAAMETVAQLLDALEEITGAHLGRDLGV